VCILLGAPVPFVLREEEDCAVLVGECYVDGVMNGEGLEHLKYELRGIGHTLSSDRYVSPVSSAPLEDFKISGRLSRPGVEWSPDRMWG